MASLHSVARCQHLTSLLVPVRNPSANLPGRVVIVASSHADGSASLCSGGRSPWPSSTPKAVRVCAIPPSATMDNASGIGITEFHRGRNILIIGGTGFLAKGDKELLFHFQCTFFLVQHSSLCFSIIPVLWFASVLVEKILRTNPDIGKILISCGEDFKYN